MTSSDPLAPLGERGLRSPRTLTLAVTGSCNLACSHCWVDSGRPSSFPHLPLPSILSIIHELAALGGSGIRFTGGEPLLHPHWLTFMAAARSRGFSSIYLQSNGTLFSDEAAAMLRELDFPGLSLQISLDGASPVSHDPVRGEGGFRKTVAGIKRLTAQGLGPRVTLFFTEMRHNLAEIPNLLELGESLGVGAVVTGALVRCGRGTGHSIAPPDPQQYLNLLHRFETDQEFRRRYERIGTTAALEWHGTQTPRPECCTFVENPYLTPGGKLYPCTLCHADEYGVSGVFDKGLAAALSEGAPLWSSLAEISRRRGATLPECRNCPEQVACAGGCMGRAWGSHGNLLTPDDRCGVRRAVGTGTGSRHLS